MGNVVITGANRGIGLELCRKFKSEGHQVFALCRNASDELNKIGVEILTDIDVTSPNIEEIIDSEFQDKKIDILINNAGIMRNSNLSDLNRQGIIEQFETNAIAPLMVGHAFIKKMNSQGKIIVITSRMGSIADNTSGGSYGYRMSKAAVNAAFKSLSHDLKEQNVAVGIIHPGWVQTDMTRNSGPMTTEQSAEGIFKRVMELNLGNSGSFWHSNGELLPW